MAYMFCRHIYIYIFFSVFIVDYEFIEQCGMGRAHRMNLNFFFLNKRKFEKIVKKNGGNMWGRLFFFLSVTCGEGLLLTH